MRKVIQSKEFICAYCELNCIASKLEDEEKTQYIEIHHPTPQCASFLNQSSGEFMRAASAHAIEKHRQS